MFSYLKNIAKHQLNKTISKQPKFVFTHVPKCAGSALSRSLLEGLYSPIIRNSSLTTGIDGKLALEVSKITGIHPQTIRQVHLASLLESNTKVFVTGHCYASPRLVDKFKQNWHFITVLRDPIDRFISEYVYNTYKKEDWNNNSLSIEEYISSDDRLNNGGTYARFFSGMEMKDILIHPEEAIEKSVENLKNYYKIGFMDNLPLWVDQLNNEFNASIQIHTSNKTPNKPIVKEIWADEKKINRIRELCRVDMAIYEEVRNYYDNKR